MRLQEEEIDCLIEKGGYEFSFPTWQNMMVQVGSLGWNLIARPGGCHPDTEVPVPHCQFWVST